MRGTRNSARRRRGIDEPPGGEVAGDGADLNAAYKNGSTSLHLAANRGHLEILGFLLDKGADVNSSDASGSTPLDEAAWKGHVEAARLLLKRGAKVNTRSEETGQTPLHEAAVKGHVDVVEVLLAAGADFSAKDSSGATAMDEALRYRHTRVVEVLAAKGAAVSMGKQLREAVLRGQTDMVAMMLSLGADGKPLLHDAALKAIAPLRNC